MTSEQVEKLMANDYIYLENMRKKDGSMVSAYVAMDDKLTKAFLFNRRPDEFVKYGEYEMRLMDKRRIEAGLVVRATVKWYDGRTARPYLWKENPTDTDYKESWPDPRNETKEQSVKPTETLSPSPQQAQRSEQHPAQQPQNPAQTQTKASNTFFVSPNKKSGPKL